MGGAIWSWEARNATAARLHPAYEAPAAPHPCTARPPRCTCAGTSRPVRACVPPRGRSTGGALSAAAPRPARRTPSPGPLPGPLAEGLDVLTADCLEDLQLLGGHRETRAHTPARRTFLQVEMWCGHPLQPLKHRDGYQQVLLHDERPQESPAKIHLDQAGAAEWALGFITGINTAGRAALGHRKTPPARMFRLIARSMIAWSPLVAVHPSGRLLSAGSAR